MFRAMTTTAPIRPAARLLGALLLCLLPARGALHAQEAVRVSDRVRAAVSALPPGGTLPVIVEFEAPQAETPALGAEPGELVQRLRSRSTLAMRGLEDGAAPADGALRVTERFWVVPAAAAEVTAAGVDRLAAMPGVRRVLSDEPLPVALEPRSSSFAAPAYTSDAMRTIGADAVWDGGDTGEGTVVAFFDSGVDGTNAMLARRWRGNRTTVRASWFDPFRRASAPQDLIGHGTQVAVAGVGALGAGDTLQLADGSTIVAASDLDVVTGPAPRAEWIAARVFDNFGGGVYTRRSVLLQAFQWALDPDGNAGTDDAPDVINNSWGILPTSGFDLCTDVLYGAIDAAEAAGIAVVFSSGNTGPSSGSVVFPAARDDAALRSFAVGASSGTTTIAVADYSGRGPSPCGGGIKPEIIAPGTVPEVRAAGDGRARLTGFTVQGTSFSTAQASGALALLRQARGGASPETLKRFLVDNAVDVGQVGPDDDAGYGLLDVPAALSAAGAQIRPRLQVAGATADDAGLTVILRNRGAAWPGGSLRVETLAADAAAASSAALPALGPGEELAARLAWSVAAPEAGVSIRVTVTGRAGDVVLSRLVRAGPPDGFGGFVLTAGDVSAGANDFGRLGRIAAPEGFRWRGTELLPAGGIAVSAGGRISDGFYVSTLGRSDLKTFGPAVETDWAPQRSFTDVAATEAQVRFDDLEALLPVGLEVTGRYEATDVSGVGALGLVLTVRNRSSQSYTDVTAGLLADWDLSGGEHVTWEPEAEALVTDGIVAGGPVTVLAADTTVRAHVELPLGTPGTGGFYEPGSGVLADSIVDAIKLDLLGGGAAGSLPGAGTATDNAALLAVGPFDLAAGASLTTRFWLLAAADTPSALARLAQLRAEVLPPPPGTGGDVFAALPPYPNPLRVGEGTIRFPYTLSDAAADAGGDMALEVYDLSGRRLYRQRASLAPGGTPPELTWDGRLAGGVEAASGVYLYVIRLDERTVSGRVLVVR